MVLELLFEIVNRNPKLLVFHVSTSKHMVGSFDIWVKLNGFCERLNGLLVSFL